MKLNYKVIGEGFPVIILHGLFGMLDNWQTIAKALAESGYMVFLIDQRDHGKSPHTSDFNYQLLANDLLHFMEENWLYQSHLIGHSMGGKTAMQFAFEHGDKIEKLVVIDVCNKNYKGGHEIVLNAIDAVPINDVKGRDEVYSDISKFPLDEGTIQFLMKNLTRTKDGHYVWKMNFELLKAQYNNILSSVGHIDDVFEGKTLFIKGEKSDYIQEEDLIFIKKQFPQSEIITVADAGHWVHADKPKEFIEVVKEYL